MKTRGFLYSAILCAAILLPAAVFAAEPSGSLPVIYVNIKDNAVISNKQEGYFEAKYWIDPKESGFEAIGSSEAPMTTEIKARGNYTWDWFDKKPYKLKLAEKTPLLGMVKNKHFALLAHADDTRGFLRNAIGFELSRRMGIEWTPTAVPVEFVLNGDYQGLYFLTETIRIDKTRTNIAEQENLETDPDLITGGWIVEIDNYDEDPHITIHEPHYESWLPDGYDINFTYDKSMDEASAEQLEFLRNSLGRVNELIYSADKTSSAELESVLDIDALARFYLVQELTDNYESFHGSCYLHRDRGSDAKWTFGPVWDFGSAFRRQRGTAQIHQNVPYYQVWIAELLKFPSVQTAVNKAWTIFRNNHREGVEQYISDFITSITSAAAADLERWPQYGNDDLQGKMQAVIDELHYNESLVEKWYGNVSGTNDATAPATAFHINGNVVSAILATNVWSIDGRKVATVAPGENVTLAAGVYILSDSNGASKIMIK